MRPFAISKEESGDGCRHEVRQRPREHRAEAETRQVYAAIAALPQEFRDALVAVDITGLSYPEAARALGVPEGTLTSRLFRARERVARRLSG